MSMLTQYCAGAVLLAAALTLPWPARAAATLVHFDTATVGTPPADCAAGLTGGGGPGPGSLPQIPQHPAAAGAGANQRPIPQPPLSTLIDAP